ncbi:hypothetical protein OVS_01950 [Mycoplasma ovis str. Michigan]|uniref:Uncharacterized protein n=1 Tax=Mycoplasma ovis str. Michigan TaxID=1415773 RepID=A0ABN4BLI1_9MOLU|nr:hypothetical protein [Mycoplasma ovis]AHC40260.1 hypothetical protein OVS_01950 [Mycoplasma ovis str. Michigan]
MSFLAKAFTGFFSIGAISLTSFVVSNQTKALSPLFVAPPKDNVENNNLDQTGVERQPNTLVAAQPKQYSEEPRIQGISASKNDQDDSQENLKEDKQQDNVLFIDLLTG